MNHTFPKYISETAHIKNSGLNDMYPIFWTQSVELNN